MRDVIVAIKRSGSVCGKVKGCLIQPHSAISVITRFSTLPASGGAVTFGAYGGSALGEVVSTRPQPLDGRLPCHQAIMNWAVGDGNVCGVTKTTSRVFLCLRRASQPVMSVPFCLPGPLLRSLGPQPHIMTCHSNCRGQWLGPYGHSFHLNNYFLSFHVNFIHISHSLPQDLENGLVQ